MPTPIPMLSTSISVANGIAQERQQTGTEAQCWERDAALRVAMMILFRDFLVRARREELLPSARWTRSEHGGRIWRRAASIRDTHIGWRALDHAIDAASGDIFVNTSSGPGEDWWHIANVSGPGITRLKVHDEEYLQRVAASLGRRFVS